MFPTAINIIDQCQQKKTRLKSKLKSAKYKLGSFRGQRNAIIDIITCDNKILIPQKLQRLVVTWYYMYLINPALDKPGETIFQYFYWSGFRKMVRKEVRKLDTCQRIKWSIKSKFSRKGCRIKYL